MAMLAEPRARKRKFNAHSAKTNANWAQETNSIGLKLIQKMGWSEGKGLGTNESGKAEPLHIAYKVDTRGLGCLNLEGDIAVAQQKGFDELLASLSQENETSNEAAKFSEKRETKSLESMSQKSRARVHYHKFTRGKDLSRASSKDLASILGLPDPDSQKKPTDNEAVVAVGPEVQFQNLKSCGSTVDYFKNLAEKRRIRMAGRDEVNNEGEKSSEDAATGGEENYPSNTSILDSSSKERRKSVTWGDVEVSFVSKYIKDMADTSTESVNDDSSDALQGTEALEVSMENGCEKKSKKKKKRKVISEPLDDATPSYDNSVIEIVDECLEVNQNKKKKKKELQEIKVNDISLDCSSSLEHSVLGNSTPTVKKKKKKKSKDKSGKLDSPNSLEATVDNANSDLVTDIGDEHSEVHHNKKKPKDMADILTESVNDSSSDVLQGTEAVEVSMGNGCKKKSKKKKKRKDIGEPLDDATPSNINSVIEIVDECSEVRQNKKKKKKEVQETEFNDISLDCSSSEYFGVDTSTPIVKKKISKGKSKKLDESPSILETSVDKAHCDLVTDIVDGFSEVSQNKKKKKERQEILNNHNSLDCSSLLEHSIVESYTPKVKKKKSKDVSGQSNESLSTLQTSVVKTDDYVVTEIFDECLVVQQKQKKQIEDIQEAGNNVDSSLKSISFGNSPMVEATPKVTEEESGKALKMKKKLKRANLMDNSSGNVEEDQKNNGRERSHAEDQSMANVEIVTLEDKKVNKKKRKQSLVEDQCTDVVPLEKKSKRPDVETSNSSTTELSSKPTLSSLTLERMEKWKQRKQSTKGSLALENNTEPVETEKNRRKRKKNKNTKKKENIIIKLKPPSDFTSDRSVVDYNYRKLYSVLGYNVKDATNKVATIVMPPTKIPGSNLDSIRGYGVECFS